MSLVYPKGLFHKFEFGHFKGLTLLEVYRGSGPVSRIIIKYLFENKLHEFTPFGTASEHNFRIACDGRFVHMLPLKHELDMSDDKGDLSDYKNNYEENFKMINEFFKNILSIEFSRYNKNANAIVIDLNKIVFYDKITHQELVFKISNEFDKLTFRGSPAYIDWCINNIDTFYVSPDTLDSIEKVDVCVFDKFELEKTSDTLYKIMQYQKKYTYRFPEKTKQVNREKFADFSSRIEKYINNQEWIEKHGDGVRKPYTEQDYIDDAFGGEASAYWNVD
jgi:hypothetical protein